MEREGRILNVENIALNKGEEEIIGQPGYLNGQINMNHYATKKSAAQSMLDVALLMANSSQLKTVLHVGPDYRFYIPLIVLLSLSITLQVVVGLLLVFIVKYDLNDVRKQRKLDTMNNVATVMVFFTVLINIFITALGFESGRESVMGLANVPVPQNSPQAFDSRLPTLGHSDSRRGLGREVSDLTQYAHAHIDSEHWHF